ncbi:MAG TPA: protein kinase [Gemmatimonadales bacterium]|nr:protein kinase [Gemmatimonadales bacterium]
MSTLPPPLATALSERYQIEREIGQGGMATVYLARDLKHDRQVALKVLRPELGAVLGAERFLAEIKITARLDHPHILTLIDSGAVDGFLYYVLPFVRGESLRDLLNREKQLGVEQALAITKQVATALDFAHRQGVIHRDIKPENILIQEGEAMLADFGIALAVKEAGGNRLTETGLSLGTPQYMSPEQATGDRLLDARSDVYSLAAVLYEMLAGEPPITGPSVQAVIAKLLTEQPTHVRIVRNTITESIDSALFKALSKVPADRFGSAGEFAKALAVPTTTASMPVPASSSQRRGILVAAGLAVVALAVGLGFRHSRAASAAPVSLRDRTQLTFTGKVETPALSPDGKQLAFYVKNCDTRGCAYAIHVQDIGTTEAHQVFEGLTAAYDLQWSPDRRNLIASGTIGGRFGSYLISTLGGTPRRLTAGGAAFYAGGDSLLIGSSAAVDSAFTIRIAGLNGTVRDSIQVPGPGALLASIISVPGSPWIIALVIQGNRGLWQVLDRTGKVRDRLLNSCTCGGTASRDALWMKRAGATLAEAVVRVGIDPTTGKFAGHQDTVYTGSFSGLSVTADGGVFTVDDGSSSYNTVALGATELFSGRLPARGPQLQGTTQVRSFISPDGSRLALRRIMPGEGGSQEARLSVMPFAGGPEVPLNLAGRLTGGTWIDSVTLLLSSQTPKGTHVALIDVRTGAESRSIDLPDSAVSGATALPNGWAWIPGTYDRIVIDQGGKRHEVTKPSWAAGVINVMASPDGSRLAFYGWNVSTSDSLGLYVVPVEGGEPVQWATSFAERGNAQWLDNSSLLFTAWIGQETVALSRVTGPGQVRLLGVIPHPADGISMSRDLKRGTLAWSDYHGDAWLYRVVKPQ